MIKILWNIVVIIVAVVVFSGISFLYHSVNTVITKEVLFTAEDNGKSATYPIGSQLTIILNKNVFPKSDWQIICSPTNILQHDGIAHLLIPPLYGEKYKGLGKGICWVRNRSFSVTIHLVDFSS